MWGRTERKLVYYREGGDEREGEGFSHLEGQNGGVGGQIRPTWYRREFALAPGICL